MNIDLIEEYRDINIDYEWWDCTYDHFAEDMKTKHITAHDMRFTGFWSQGDGASFTGYINDTKAFLEAHDIAETYPWVMRLLAMGGDCDISITRSSTARYCHENTVYAEANGVSAFRWLVTYDDDDVRRAVVEQWDQELQAEIDKLDNHVTELIRDYCCDLYLRLEKEHDYLTSDEAVWDAIVAHDLDKVLEEEIA